MFNHPFNLITQDGVSIHFLSFKNSLLQSISQAKKRVWILSYVINCNLNKAGDPITAVFSMLRKKKLAGCDVRVVLDNPQANKPNFHCNKFFMRRLMEWGIPFQTPPTRVTSHAKAILIDEKVLFIGSHNLAKSSLLNPLDCTVEIHNAFLIQSFAETYRLLWSDGAMVSYTPADIQSVAHDG